MKDLRNPIERRNFTHPAGNTMTELKEAELNNFAAGAGIYVPEESCSEQAAGNLRKFHN